MLSRAPMLIALPSGLIVSGVATWAARLVSALCAAGRPAGLILHAPPDGHARLDLELHPSVRVFDLSRLPRFEDVSGRSDVDAAAARESWVRAYADAARQMARLAPGSPVILSPNLHADCYAVATALARREPDLVRLVGWQHNDIEYDRRVLAHYEPALASVVGVSDHITTLLRTLIATRPVASLAYGVEIERSPRPREPLLTGSAASAGARPIRLLYTGRLDHHQKRILALPHLSSTLLGMGIDHTLTIMGDGPAADELDQLAASLGHASRHVDALGDSVAERGRRRSSAGRGGAAVAPAREPGPMRTRLPIARTGPATPAQVRRALAEHDAFILPSRFEGLSVSMLEALAAGCVPVVARVASGALQAIEPGVTGLIAEVGPDAAEDEVGRALAQEVARLMALDAGAMSRRAWASAFERFSLAAHARGAAAIIDAAAAAPPASWPESRPIWFTDIGGSVPADAPARLAAVLQQLAGRDIAVHGAGLHTRTLLEQFLSGPARVVAITDDDRQRHGDSLGGVPIIAPDQAGARGATDVVISTAMHEAAVWERRAVYERQRVRVHRLYA